MESLTTAQQFELERMRRDAEKLTHAQALQLLIDAQRLLMIKSNVLETLSRQCNGHGITPSGH